mgnify:CR=1 FL=1
MGMFEGSDVDSTEQAEFEAQLKNKNPDSRMTIEQLTGSGKVVTRIVSSLQNLRENSEFSNVENFAPTWS